jgi:hypothetical protein
VTTRTALQIAAGVVTATLTGITVNLATAEGASPWTWLAVIATTGAGIAVAIWAARPPADPGGRPTANGAGSPHTTFNVYGDNLGTVGTHVQHTEAARLRSPAPWLVLAGLGTGLAIGLGALPIGRVDPNPAPPTVTVTPSPVAPTTTVGVDPTTEIAPVPHPHTSERPAPAPRQEPVDPPVTESPVGDWLSLDRTFETLHLYSDGTYRRENPPGDDETGPYRVDGSRLTFAGGGAGSGTFTWSIHDALLTLTDGGGSSRQYTRG